MTVKLLMDWPDSRDGKNYVAGNLLTTDAGTESGLVATKMATATLTGGTAYVAPVAQKQRYDVQGEFDPLTGKTILTAAGIVIKTGGSLGATSGITSFKPNGGNGTALTAGSTQTTSFTVPKSFKAVRIMFVNYNTGAALNIVAKVSASPLIKPISNGSLLSPVSVTKNGSSAISIPAATTVSGRPVPGVIYSDIIPLQSVARSDIPSEDPVFYMRTYSAQQVTIAGQDWSTGQGGLTGRTGVGNTGVLGDNVTAWGSVDLSYCYDYTFNMPLCHFDFYTGGDTAKIALFGDSLTCGSNIANPALALMNNFNLAGYDNLTVANYGNGGDFRDQTSAIMRAICGAEYKPDIAIVWDYSVNSDNTQVGLDAQFKIMIDDVEYIQSKGIKPAIITMHPSNFGGVRFAHTARVKALYGGSVPILDLSTLLAPAGTILAPMTTDNTHLTPLGYTTFCDYAAPMLLAML